MSDQREFEVILDEAVFAHFAAIERKDRSMILDAIGQQLAFDPFMRTHNRKPLRIPNSLDATWELRCGQRNRYRVFYDVLVEDRIVIVLAVGHKRGNRLWIGKEEMDL